MEKNLRQTRYPGGLDQERYEAIVKYANQIVKDSVIKNDKSGNTSGLENRVSK